MIAIVALVGAWFLRFRHPRLDEPFMSEDVQMGTGFWEWILDHDIIVGGTLCALPVVIVVIGAMIIIK